MLSLNYGQSALHDPFFVTLCTIVLTCGEVVVCLELSLGIVSGYLKEFIVLVLVRDAQVLHYNAQLVLVRIGTEKSVILVLHDVVAIACRINVTVTFHQRTNLQTRDLCLLAHHLYILKHHFYLLTHTPTLFAHTH